MAISLRPIGAPAKVTRVIKVFAPTEFGELPGVYRPGPGAKLVRQISLMIARNRFFPGLLFQGLAVFEQLASVLVVEVSCVAA